MNNTNTTVILYWDNMNIVEKGHRIYRSDNPFNKSSTPEPIALVNRGSNRYVDRTAQEGKTYYYMVGAYTEYHEEFSKLVTLTARSDEVYFRTNSTIGMANKDGMVEWEIDKSVNDIHASPRKKLYFTDSDGIGSMYALGGDVNRELATNSSNVITANENIYHSVGSELYENGNLVFTADNTIRFMTTNAVISNIIWLATTRYVYAIDVRKHRNIRTIHIPRTIIGIEDTTRDGVLIYSNRHTFVAKKGFHQTYLLQDESYNISSSTLVWASPIGKDLYVIYDNGNFILFDSLFNELDRVVPEYTPTNFSINSSGNLVISDNEGNIHIYRDNLVKLYSFKISNSRLEEIDIPYVSPKYLTMPEIGYYPVSNVFTGSNQNFKLPPVITTDFWIDLDYNLTGTNTTLKGINPTVIPTIAQTMKEDIEERDFEVFISPVIIENYNTQYNISEANYEHRITSINPNKVSTLSHWDNSESNSVEVFISPVIIENYNTQYNISEANYEHRIASVNPESYTTKDYPEFISGPKILDNSEINNNYY